MNARKHFTGEFCEIVDCELWHQPTVVEYMTGVNADSHFPVTGARIYGRELRVGDTYWGAEVLSILFYTGFAGCPARYYIRTTRSTTIANATGIYVERLNRSEYQDLPGNTRGPLWPAEMR